jgi:polyphosphate kinase
MEVPVKTAAEETPRFFNREMSWLQFNHRVLEHAMNSSKPLLERVRFLSIAASNLDEFFMVRVGGLQKALRAGTRRKDPAGLTPSAQLSEVYARTAHMMERMHHCFDAVLSPALQEAGIRHRRPDSLNPQQTALIRELFTSEIYPVLTPVAVGPDGAFPHVSSLSLHLLVSLSQKAPESGKSLMAVIPLHRYGQRVVHIPSRKGFCFILREQIAKYFADLWFPGYFVRDTAVFRVTRNADFAVEEDEAPDLVMGMEEILKDRKTGDCVRLEVEAGTSEAMVQFLAEPLGAEKRMVYSLAPPLDLSGLAVLCNLEGYDGLKYPNLPPCPPVSVNPSEPMFSQISAGDILLHHPYESYDPVIRFIEEAACDPATMAIKIVLYRTSSRSPVIEALKKASDNGVNVTVLLELKARFDEERNIGWVRELEPRGIQVVYGVKGFKTHAKICLIVRRELNGIARYCHFATGNYNESTARFYSDISYFTADPELGEDASSFFNALCGYSQPTGFRLVSMSPVNLRKKLINLIDGEIQRARAGKEASITAKLNSLTDAGMIEKLYDASRAGVTIRLNIRGICCLVPGVAGQSDNITVTGIVDRYLEHARILCFHHGGRNRVFITSADWMARNLDRRLELLVPVNHSACSRKLVHILDTHLSNTGSSWLLKSDGTYESLAQKNALSSQEVLHAETSEHLENLEKKKPTRFRPHRPVED